VITDHDDFVLINVYVPNEGGESGERRGFKCRFLRALKRMADKYLSAGRKVWNYQMCAAVDGRWSKRRGETDSGQLVSSTNTKIVLSISDISSLSYYSTTSTAENDMILNHKLVPCLAQV